MKLSGLAAVGLVAALTFTAPAGAQTPAPSAQLPVFAAGMTQPEYQGMGCLVGGLLGSVGVYAYSDIIAIAATGAVNPLLLVPVMATGFALGCSVGYNISPIVATVGKAF